MSVVEKSGVLFVSEAVRIMRRTARPVLLGLTEPLHLGPLPVDVFFRCGAGELLEETADDRLLVVPVFKARVFPVAAAAALYERWPFVSGFGLLKERPPEFLAVGAEVSLRADIRDAFGDLVALKGTRAVVDRTPRYGWGRYGLKLTDSRTVWVERQDIAGSLSEATDKPAWGRDPNFELWEVTTRHRQTGFRRVDGPVWSLPGSLIGRLIRGRIESRWLAALSSARPAKWAA